MVVFPVFNTPKPIARTPTGADIIWTLSSNDCRAFANGVMQAIIEGRPQGREVIRKQNTLISITTLGPKKFVKLTTCIMN